MDRFDLRRAELAGERIEVGAQLNRAIRQLKVLYGATEVARVQAEDFVMRYVAEAGLPAVAMCVSTTYGSGDWGRTPHGAFIAGAVFGKLPFLMDGIQLEVVGVEDAARAMIIAAERGRIGERYLISERMISLKEVVRIAADEAGVPPPRRSISLPMLYALGALGSLKARITGKDAELSLDSVRMMRAEAEVDHSKAVRELGWQPRSVEESIREAARFWAALKGAHPDTFRRDDPVYKDAFGLVKL